MNTDIIIRAERLCYRYEDGTDALNGMDLSVRRGEKLAVMGANGSGKSTFFLCLNGVHRPSSGTVYLDGRPLDYSKKGLLALRRRVGIVFQDPDQQLFSADVFGEISFGPLNLGLDEEEARRRVEDVIRELNIAEFQDKPVHFLSGGQKKRVAIADILVMRPDVMILDEPTAALDPKHARLVDSIIDGLSENGMTVILSTRREPGAFVGGFRRAVRQWEGADQGHARSGVPKRTAPAPRQPGNPGGHPAVRRAD